MSIVRKLFWAIVTLFAVLVLLFFLHPYLLPAYAHFFSVHNATKGADALICLSGGRISRTPETLRLWNQGYAPRLFVTAEKPKNSEFAKLEMSHLQYAQAVSKWMKFDANWSVLPSLTGGATSTFDEAEDALARGLKEGWKRIIIVTDEFHTRRALLAFEKVFNGSGIKVEAAGAVNEVFDASNWWKTDFGILCFLGESVKYPIYLLWDEEPKLVGNY
ncbi:MAG: hypothetical protein CMI27_05570 [Opitutae bacterium]|nr:hypothetical protein [Opitutae bacterium]|tara:strand:+ start:10324 stop:10977 length:654 start_codon:yes stop_codon:yes gene_type:complete